MSNILAIIGEEPSEDEEAGKIPVSNYVIANPEGGVITVLATHAHQERIQLLIDQVVGSAQRQVLIEATVVEVVLTDRYRAGIDWTQLADKGRVTLQQSLLGGGLGTAPFFRLNANYEEVDVTVRALSEFGDVQVLSSPKMMVLNNQTALLKVVDNEVYFTVDVETTSTQGVINTTFDTTPHTVPVGFVMSVTPGIFENDSIILNVRPTISRIARTVNDPNPALANAGVTSPIPVIETRGIESVLKVISGQTAVLGGLMQDDQRTDTEGVPFLSKIYPIGELFKDRDNDYRKSELVVFLRPTVIRDPSLKGDFKDYRNYLNRELDTNVVAPGVCNCHEPFDGCPQEGRGGEEKSCCRTAA